MDALTEAMYAAAGGQDELPLESGLPDTTPPSAPAVASEGPAGTTSLTAALTAASLAAGSAGAVPLPRLRLRAAIPIDVVTFGSACPACGEEATWTEEREDTRMRLSIDCATCPPLPTTEAEGSEQPQLGRRVGPAWRAVPQGAGAGAASGAGLGFPGGTH